jgi:hypothetical protein
MLSTDEKKRPSTKLEIVLIDCVVDCEMQFLPEVLHHVGMRLERSGCCVN